MHLKVSLSVEVTIVIYYLYFLGLAGIVPNYESFNNHVRRCLFMTVVIYTSRINNDNNSFVIIYKTFKRNFCARINYCEITF